MMPNQNRLLLVALAIAAGCSGVDETDPDCSGARCDDIDIPDDATDAELAEILEIVLIDAAAENRPDLIPWNKSGLDYFKLPHRDDYASEQDYLDAIPQDHRNPLTPDKIALGMDLFHDPGVMSAPRGRDEAGQIVQSGVASCSTCHNAEAGFKPGIRNAQGEGGMGYGFAGRERVIDPRYVPDSRDQQARSAPTFVNSAFVPNQLWDGRIGFGVNNKSLPGLLFDRDQIMGNPLNLFTLGPSETEGLGGQFEHRHSRPHEGVQNTAAYSATMDDVFPPSVVDILVPDNLFSNPLVSFLFTGAELMDAFANFILEPTPLRKKLVKQTALAIGAYMRSALANEAPFQKWLRGDDKALTSDQLKGAILFFGKAKCVGCHTGPGLSNSGFQAVGFRDLGDFRSIDDARAAGRTLPEFLPETAYLAPICDARENCGAIGGASTGLGRGSFTKRSEDDFKFKTPTLYNVADASIMGHGGSFFDVRDVVVYFNEGVAENPRTPASALDERFAGGLGLSDEEIDFIVAFVKEGLRDPDLLRYQPTSLPSGNCIIAADEVRLESDAACQ